MKIATASLLIVGAIAVAGCVTEGSTAPEPAPAAEQAEANLALGIGYLREERPDLAIDALQRAIEIQPRNVDAHSAIAIAYDQIEEVDLAEQHHRRATQLAPRSADAQNGYAVFLCRQNRWNDAEPYFDRAIDASPRQSSLTPVMNAATCAARAGDIEATENYLRSALAIDAANVDALRGMVDISIRTADFFQGRAFWTRLVQSTEIQPQDLFSCYVIESSLDADAAASACADRLQREFPESTALRQLRDFERDGG